MRAVTFHRFGEPADVLRWEDVPMPEPGPGEVLVRPAARPINPSDLLPVRGAYPHRTPLPGIAGHEAVGRVAARGPGVTAPKVGDRVLPVGGPGAWAEYKLCRAEACVPVPEGLPDETACQLYVNPVTAWAILTDVLGAAPGDRIVANAAGSAFGRILAQLCRARGLRMIGLVRRAEHVAPLLALGAAAVVDASAEPVLPRIAALTGGEGARAALDAVGGEEGAALLDALAPGGTLVNYGLLSGRPLVLASDAAAARHVTLRGFWLRDWLATVTPEHRRAAFDAVIAQAAADALTVEVAARYPLDEIAAAVRHAERPGRAGKVLLVG